ncbi:MAG: GntR family transcriptional regulator [Spirochaetaceae bacterium]|nr:GntR family transcriptional regulator [Spirochaetaceae bacterium]
MRFNNDRPIFAQIADFLAAEVLAGRLPPGGRLPSARELAVSLEVNPNTAARALQALAETGVARCERGTGYFVAEPGLELALAERRRRFFDEELPRLWTTMDELGLGLDELSRRWAERGSAKEKA